MEERIITPVKVPEHCKQESNTYCGFHTDLFANVFDEPIGRGVQHFREGRLESSAGTGYPAKSSRFERDKFPGYLFVPVVDALTDSRTI